jgi:hypothetical protein
VLTRFPISFENALVPGKTLAGVPLKEAAPAVAAA